MTSPAPAVAFTMRGAREAVDGGIAHVEQTVIGLERAVAEDSGLAFELAKSLVESVCKSILTTRGVSFSAKDDVPRLFTLTAGSIPLLPPELSGETEVRRSLAQTVNGLHTALQGICELRNACGPISHGSAGPKPVLDSLQALLAAEAADTIVGFLHRAHSESSKPRARDLQYEDYPELNEFIDEACEPVKVLDYEFVPSMVLFQMDRVAYQDVLAQNFVTDAPEIAIPEGGIGLIASVESPQEAVES